MNVEYHPIGIIHSPFQSTEGTPIQPSAGPGLKGTVEVFPEFSQGLKDLSGFSHVVLIYHLHHSVGYHLLVVPFLDTEERGVFATRAPRRPNSIGLSVVRLVDVEGNTLHVENMDVVDGTPLLDIKPYVPDFDSHVEVRIGWLEKVRERLRDSRADGRFKQ
ncbi:MAG: tRNA (N6-threonylcarbamoyladenosine(37)-N6)-methyltransferase TrmO [Candidatus Eisenbacteria bacterium]|nr:tRNA (N6-threonylcarbamoyladenosine(37)-N6)-methyltransferase TrmO [Candidatus Eisenbacteria bacterium]